MRNPLARTLETLRQHRLGLRVMAAILLCSFVFAVLATGVQLYVDYRNELGRIEQRLNDVRDSYAESMVHSLWALDYAQVELQLAGIRQLPDVAFVSVRDETGRVLSAGQPPGDAPVETLEVPLIHRPAGAPPHRLGTLTVTADLSGVYQRLWERLLVILGTQAVKTFGVAVLILLIFHYLVTRHLGALAAWTRRLDLGHLDEAPRLKRPPSPSGDPDELDEVVRALDEMRESLRRDIRARARAELELRKLSAALEQSPTAVMITDLHGVVEYVNPRFCELTGFTAEEVNGSPSFGHHLGIFQIDSETEGIERDLRHTVLNRGDWRGELHCRHKTGRRFWVHMSVGAVRDPDRGVSHIVAVMEDITQLREYEERLVRQANYDELTGLPNRLLAFDRLNLALESAARNGCRAALAYLDLDDFKTINETLGHAAGDEVLRQAATRLRKAVDQNCTVARFGADEFLIIVPDVEHTEPLEFLTEHVLDAFTHAFEAGGRRVYYTATMGIAVYPADGEDAQTLLRNADTAMHAAKRQARNSYRFFDASMNERANARLQLESALRVALEKREFTLHYQPVVAARDRKPACMEALLRWQQPGHGLIAPDDILPIAEETGLILPLSEWVLHTACARARAWLDAGRELPVAVNISARHVQETNIARLIRDTLRQTGLPPRLLLLEVTEHVLLQDTPHVGRMLRELALMGVRLAIDDFGTGYSALGHLKRFSFHAVKIDRSFITQVTESQDAAALVRAIIGMTHNLGLQVIAEGVETAAQFRFLQENGCDYMQGYYLGKPRPADDPALLVVAR